MQATSRLHSIYMLCTVALHLYTCASHLHPMCFRHLVVLRSACNLDGPMDDRNGICMGYEEDINVMC